MSGDGTLTFIVHVRVKFGLLKTLSLWLLSYQEPAKLGPTLFFFKANSKFFSDLIKLKLSNSILKLMIKLITLLIQIKVKIKSWKLDPICAKSALWLVAACLVGAAPPLWVNGKPDSTNLRKGCTAVVRALRPKLFVVL